jgi:FkbM family methyltransferase
MNIDFEEILSLPMCLKKNESLYNHPVILYGAGIGGDYYLKYLQRYNLKPVAICDTYKAEQHFYGYTICSIEDILGKYQNPKIIITSSRFYEQIKKQLLEYFPEDDLITSVSEINREKLCDFRSFLQSNMDALNTLYNRLEDEKSRETMINVLKGRVSGDNHWSLKSYAADQYFAEDFIALGANESFIDGGAYVGDTAEVFICKTNNKFDKIFCFEPSSNNFSKLASFKEKYQQDSRIILYKAGLYSENTRLGFNDESLSPSNAISASASDTVDVVSIDQTIHEKVTFIKMDIEGAELEALKGARETILKYRPKLAICVYHKNEDLIEIPEFIMSLGLDYRYYLRHHNPYAFSETVFYAV